METTKLTIRIPVRVMEQAKAYARDNQTSVTRLVSQYLSQLPVEESFLGDAPIVRRLIGILPSEVSTDDYLQHLEEKYGDAFAGSDRSEHHS
jgi:hypothetical protein